MKNDFYLSTIHNLENIAIHIHWFNLVKSYQKIKLSLKRFELNANQKHDKYALNVCKQYQTTFGSNHYFFVKKHNLYLLVYLNQQPKHILYKAKRANLLKLIHYLISSIRDTYSAKYANLYFKNKIKR